MGKGRLKGKTNTNPQSKRSQGKRKKGKETEKADDNRDWRNETWYTDYHGLSLVMIYLFV